MISFPVISSVIYFGLLFLLRKRSFIYTAGLMSAFLGAFLWEKGYRPLDVELWTASLPILAYLVASFWLENSRLAAWATFFSVGVGSVSLLGAGIFLETGRDPLGFLATLILLIFIRPFGVNSWEGKVAIALGFIKVAALAVVVILGGLQFISLGGNPYWMILDRGWFGILTLFPLVYLLTLERTRIKIRAKREVIATKFPGYLAFWMHDSKLLWILYLPSLVLMMPGIYYLVGGMLSAMVWDHFFLDKLRIRLGSFWIGSVSWILFQAEILRWLV